MHPRAGAGGHVDAFASRGRGEAETASLLAYYGVPLLLTTDDGVFALTSGAEVVVTDGGAGRRISALAAHGT